jgi:hypothetical protein
MPEEDLPDPDEVQDQMRFAIERIRAKLVESDAEAKSDTSQAEGRADELS